MVCFVAAPRDGAPDVIRSRKPREMRSRHQGPYLVTRMSDFNAETDEDNGNAKPAGPVWGIVGGLIGLVVALSLFWFLVSHR
jgi:hypothetical protein